MPDHPYANSNHYVLEHRLVMEKHLGRYLVKGEDVHHINSNRKDNKIKNLRLMIHNDHSRMEQTGRKLSEETKIKMRLAHKDQVGYWTGKHLSEEHKRNLSLANIGRIVSEETKHKLGIRMLGNTYGRANKGKSYSHEITEETREKIRLARLGKPHPHKSHKQTEEAKLKMRLAKLGNTFAKKKVT